MILGIGAVLVLAILVYAAVALRGQARQLLEVSRREAELVALLAERAVARAMTEGKSAEVQGILEQIGGAPHLAGIRIVGPEGTVLRSTKPEEAGRQLPPADRPDGRGGAPVWDHRERTVAVSRPIANRPTCYACHAPDQATLGFLDVRLSFLNIESEIARQWKSMVVAAILVLVAAGGLIALYFTVAVSRHVETVCRAMARVEAGELTVKVPETDRAELGRLGRSFNTMVARLADAQRQLADRHAAQIRRAEHLASLGKMAASIAHEINNPLAGMQNCVRTLLRGVRDEAQRTQYLGMLQEGLGRIGRTVTQLLDLSREAKPQLVPTQLAPLLERCLALVQHELGARQISSDVSLEPGLPVLRADPHQLEQVFLNILMNALEAMPSGGSLKVDARTRPGEPGCLVEVRVTDTGVGIPPENLARIFDPFFTTKETGRGTGLGLSVSHGIVKAHGGFIDVRSEVGRGSSVTVTLPA